MTVITILKGSKKSKWMNMRDETADRSPQSYKKVRTTGRKIKTSEKNTRFGNSAEDLMLAIA